MGGGGQLLPAPYNSVISKDMDLKFGMLKKRFVIFSNCKEMKPLISESTWQQLSKNTILIYFGQKYFKSYGDINVIWSYFCQNMT